MTTLKIAKKPRLIQTKVELAKDNLTNLNSFVFNFPAYLCFEAISEHKVMSMNYLTENNNLLSTMNYQQDGTLKI